MVRLRRRGRQIETGRIDEEIDGPAHVTRPGALRACGAPPAPGRDHEILGLGALGRDAQDQVEVVGEHGVRADVDGVEAAQVMQALDTLGAGFQLASHDLDIRGAGNLLGEEQSGHIREVGIELYQQLIEEAVAAAKGGEGGVAAEDWSPQITVGTPVLLPESYVQDLSVRLSLYRRIGALSDKDEIDALAAELVDRFGKLPAEVENLLEVVAVKVACKKAGIEKIDAGPKGAVVTFRGNTFANPLGLVKYISQQVGTAKMRPDHKVVFIRDWDDPKRRVGAMQKLVGKLAEIAASQG